MPIRIYLPIFLVWSQLISCKSQAVESSTIENNWKIQGDRVHELGKNLDCIFEDSRGHIWIASNGDGVFVYDGKNMLHVTQLFGLCSNYVTSIQEDKHGRIWFSTREGYCCYDGKQFIQYNDTISQAPFRKIDQWKNGLFFPHDTAVCYYDGDSFLNFMIHPTDYRIPTSSLYRAYGIYSTWLDEKGILWLGTQENGVAYGNGNGFRYLKDKNLAGPAVRIVYQSKDGKMWFGNNGGGLFIYDGKEIRNITQELKKENLNFLVKRKPESDSNSLARVFDIKEDEKGNIWVATIDAGIWKFNGNSWKQYTMKDGLPSNSVWRIFVNRDGALWFIVGGEKIMKIENEKFIAVFK